MTTLKSGTINRSVDEYGFETLDVQALNGGHKTITYFGPGTVDIGTVHGDNGVGMAGMDYIRNVDDIERHRQNVHRTTWLTIEEKGFILDFLDEIEAKQNGFLKVKERFDVKFEYAPESRKRYTFTEKEPAITLHTKITMTVEQPSGWDEGNAWRALYDVLNPKREIEDWRLNK